MIRVHAWLPPQRLPEEVYAELVDILFRAITPLISIGVPVAGIGAMMFAITGDHIVGALTLAWLALSTVRVGLNLAYRRRRTLAPPSLSEVKKWEMAFGAGIVVAALLLGSLNVYLLMAGDVASHLLVSAPGSSAAGPARTLTQSSP